MAQYFLRLNQFEGPLDLLLNLIRVNEIDIFNIDIVVLTTQYLDHLRLLQSVTSVRRGICGNGGHPDRNQIAAPASR